MERDWVTGSYRFTAEFRVPDQTESRRGERSVIVRGEFVIAPGGPSSATSTAGSCRISHGSRSAVIVCDAGLQNFRLEVPRGSAATRARATMRLVERTGEVECPAGRPRTECVRVIDERRVMQRARSVRVTRIRR